MNKRYAVVAPIALGEIGKPQMLLKTGMYHFRDIGDHEFTPDDLREMVANFKAGVYGQDIAVNIEHMHEFGALGDVLDIWTQNNDTELWGVFDYNDFGAPQVKEGRWHYNSVEVYHEWQHPVTKQVYHNVLFGVAHTNYPRIKNMQKIAASEGADLPEFVPMDDPDITPAKPHTKPQGVLTVDEKEQLAKLAERQTQFEAKMGEMQKSLEAAEAARKEAETKLTAAEASVATLTARLAETDKQLGIERNSRLLLEFNEGLDKALRELRITPAEKEAYLGKAGDYTDAVRDFILADVKSREPRKATFAEQGSGNSRSGEATPGGDGVKVETRVNDAGQTVLIHRERADLAERAKSIMASEKVSYPDALKKAAKQLSEGGK